MQVHLTSTTAALYQFKYPTLAPVAALVRLARSWWIVAAQLLVRSPGHNGTPTPRGPSVPSGSWNWGLHLQRNHQSSQWRWVMSQCFGCICGDIDTWDTWSHILWYVICDMWYVIQEYTAYIHDNCAFLWFMSWFDTEDSTNLSIGKVN